MSMIDTAMMGALSRFLDVDVGRMKLIGSNLANIDTPGFQTRDLDFRAELARTAAEAAGSEQGNLSYAPYTAASYGHAAYEHLAYAPVVRRVRGLLVRPDGNNVSVERESLLLAETQMKFNLGVALLKDEFHTISQAINSGGGTS
jgi:flagellar basal-body rod protein FlgB